MPRFITQYRVFIASPGGLDEERRAFFDTLEKYSTCDAEPRGVLFHPVGWEDTLGGVGRPQELINEDLKQCDYAFFLLHDRWGSPTGSGYTSGLEEEWKLAEQLYAVAKLRNMVIFFKLVDSHQLKDPGNQLKQVLGFRETIAAEKKYLFRDFDKIEEFCEHIRRHLAKWLRDHERKEPPQSLSALERSTVGFSTKSTSKKSFESLVSPGFYFWIDLSDRLFDGEPHKEPDYHGALFCSEQALAIAESCVERARANHAIGKAKYYLKELPVAYSTFDMIVEKLHGSTNAEELEWVARALVSKGATLWSLGRSEEAIAVYDDVIARFGGRVELPLRESVAKALVNKGVALSSLGRSDEEIAVYDDVVSRFAGMTELVLRRQVAQALFNKGVALGSLGRSDEAIAVYNDVVDRFGGATEPVLREQVVTALFNKGVRLRALGRCEEAIGTYDDLVARFGSAIELTLRERVAEALLSKGATLGSLGLREDAIQVYDGMVDRFGSSTELALRKLVACALFNKGLELRDLKQDKEARLVLRDIIATFGSEQEPELKAIVDETRKLLD